ncbi:SUKH-3 domain-containing protein [Spirillospora sp. NPDC052242]
MSDRFAEDVDSLLRAAGWFGGRSTDTAPCLQAWKSLGLQPEASPVGFIREFDGLHIEHPPYVDIGEARHFDFTNFDAVASVHGLRERAYREYTVLAGLRLCPIGQNRAHMTLMIGAQQIFAGVDNYLFTYCNGLDSGVTAMLRGEQPTKFGEWHP